MRESRTDQIPLHLHPVAKAGISRAQDERLSPYDDRARCLPESSRMTTAAAGQGAGGERNWEGQSATGISRTGTLHALGLLAKGCFIREILRAPFQALWKDILLPAGVVCFFTFLHTDATARGGWPMLAIAGAIWLFFANSVRQGGMMLWHERWLLRDGKIPAGLLLTAAALVPITLFGVHVSLIRLALQVRALPQDGRPVEVLLAGGIAAATGLGAGILAARLSGLRPKFASALPKLLLVSLILTPVFYRLSSLESFGQVWCMVNPLCAATELARAGISLEPEPLPRHAKTIACGLSVAILCWGLLTLRLPPTTFAGEHD